MSSFDATYKGQMKKKNQEILGALQYKPLYNNSRSEKWGKKIKAAAYNGAHTVYKLWIIMACIGYIDPTLKNLDNQTDANFKVQCKFIVKKTQYVYTLIGARLLENRKQALQQYHLQLNKAIA